MKKLIIITMLLITAPLLNVNAQLSKLWNFAGVPDGSYPQGSLVSYGTYLYGTTSYGGAYDLGTIYKVMPDGTSYSILHDFAGTTTDGGVPLNGLIYDAGFLYGMTYGGGTYNGGTVFRIMTNGTGFEILHNFDGTLTGRRPYSTLLKLGTFLYGTTAYGGENDSGTVFKIKPDGTEYSKLHDFLGTDPDGDGSIAFGSLIFDGTFLYGMTASGGDNNMGTIYKIMTDGTGYTKILDFEGITNGRAPYASLIYDGTFLYGTTFYGGEFDKGVIFKILPDGTGYVNLHDFAGVPDGQYPFTTLVSDAGILYGVTSFGGDNDLGTIFKIMPDGTGYLKRFNFTGTTSGSWPVNNLISDGTFLYGIAQGGGDNDLGTVFKFTVCTTLEVCNGFDDNCDGLIDNPVNPSTTNITTTTAQLNWTTMNNVMGYNVQYRKVGSNGWTSKNVNNNLGIFNLNGLKKNTSYEWKVRTRCSGNSYGDFTLPITFTTLTAREDLGIASNNNLTLNCNPNPFSGITSIQFSLVHDDFATMIVIDVTGREIEKLFDGAIEAGNIYEVTFDGSKFDNGIYFLILNTQIGTYQTRKLILQK
jgi:uncharacterized repeat protein (TIGR03803 family)